MRQISLAIVFCLSGVTSLWAAGNEKVARLYDALGMQDVIAIMQQEGLAYGEDLRAEMFPGRGGAAWNTMVARLYDVEAMDELVSSRFAVLMEGTDTAPLIEFFESELGARIIRLEISARRALVDPDVEATAQAALDDMRQAGDPRLDILDDFVDANDLIEANVVGAMNSNYAFYSGLLDGDAFNGDMTEADVLADVWGQEPTIRADTIEWVYGYLTLAYQPLSDADVEAYTALARTTEGQAMNQAIFGAFDAMYVTISRALGQGAAQFISGEDL
ncbi:DUF2059 domain-containing protein [Oceaniglobus indicus]|uniref:DUF2059 domain-containing protein n=1 Tax=Oceaniglobus indicus TaxID=2047749 RepID=UPI000C1A7316|nr:DUF2059 domain-containing protein [Oceaniglobus indicus]